MKPKKKIICTKQGVFFYATSAIGKYVKSQVVFSLLNAGTPGNRQTTQEVAAAL